MTTNKLWSFAPLQNLLHKNKQTAVMPYEQKSIQRPTTVVPTIVLKAPMPNSVPTHQKLSQLILSGRQHHPQAVGSFVEQVTAGYYAYEQRTEWRTCALAAAYVGAFGPNAINERTGQSMVNAGLEPLIGYHPDMLTIAGPPLPINGGTAHHVRSVSATIQALNDNHGWTRLAIARWLAQQGL